MSLDVDQQKLATEAKEGILKDPVSWLERAKSMSLSQIQDLHSDFDKRVAKLSRARACDDPVVKQLKRLKLRLKDIIEEKGGTILETTTATKRAAWTTS